MEQLNSLKTDKKFKKTEIGDIPVDWEISKLEKVISLKYGEGLPENKREGKPYPVYGSNGIVGYHSKFLVNGPGIIVGRKGSIGNIAWSDRDFWPIDTTYYVTMDPNKTNFRWLFYYLIHLRLDRLNAATGIPGLNRQVALETKIAMPPLPEQKKIAEILITVDEAIEKSDEIIEKTKELKKGLMQELLTRGIGHKKFKKTKIGEIPVDWEVIQIHNLCTLGRGRVISQKEIDNNPGQYPVFSSQSKDKGVMGYINSYDFDGEYVTWTTDGAYAGTVFYRGGKFNCTNVCGTLKSRVEFIDMWYLCYALNRLTKRHVVLCGNPKLMNNVMAQIKVQIPPLAEQKKIAEILSAADEDIERAVDNKKKLEIIKKGLMQVLLTGKVRVRI